MAFKNASELAVDDWFIDPRREGRRPAKVIELVEVPDVDRLGNKRTDTDVHMVLDDDTKGGPWSASYGSDESLEMLGRDGRAET